MVDLPSTDTLLSLRDLWPLSWYDCIPRVLGKVCV